MDGRDLSGFVDAYFSQFYRVGVSRTQGNRELQAQLDVRARALGIAQAVVGVNLRVDPSAPYRNRIARIPASPAFSIKGTYGGMGVYASGVSLQRLNIEPAGTIRFQGYSDAAWTTQVVDTGTVAAVTLYPFPEPVLRLTLETMQREGDRMLSLVARGQF